MTPLSERTRVMALINAARHAGARVKAACAAINLCHRTWTRWQQGHEDQRPLAAHPIPANKLSELDRQRIIGIVNSPDFASLPVPQIVPKLADRGVYIASESSFYRVLHESNMATCRDGTRSRTVRPISTHCAMRPNQVWCWDITYLPAAVKGEFHYWYMIKDIYSAKIVGSEVYRVESAEHAANLLSRAVLREGVRQPLVLHSDNGGPMKGATMHARMQELNVVPSRSRPRVSNDNAHAETLFRTAKYRPDYPARFESLEHARAWVAAFVRWYNTQHCHSSIAYLTPDQHHRGAGEGILANRRDVYERARQRHPERWSGAPRRWETKPEVWLNPERQTSEQPTIRKRKAA